MFEQAVIANTANPATAKRATRREELKEVNLSDYGRWPAYSDTIFAVDGPTPTDLPIAVVSGCRFPLSPDVLLFDEVVGICVGDVGAVIAGLTRWKTVRVVPVSDR
jgi:hypothetical protein